MPTSTDLVTDLPADFEVFGQAVDTDFVDLLGGTTGQVLSKTSATDLDFTWINNDQGDITGVTAGNGISVTSPTGPVPTVAIDTTVTVDKTTAQTLTNKTLTSPALTTPTISTATTNGDLLYGTGSGALQRLGIGSAGQSLQVAGGVPSWATAATGAMTLISTTSFSGATTANIDGIFSSTYTKYQIILTRWSASASLDVHMKFRYGSTTESAANYYQTSKGINVNDTTSTLTEAGGTKMRIGTETQGPGGILNLTFVDIGTSAIQPYFSGIWSGMSTTTQLVGGTKNGTQQVYTGLQFLSSSGNVAGTISVYGLAS